MFIRKRVNHSKRYGVTERYQVCETYREGGKVKQRVLAGLGSTSNPIKALERAEEDLRLEESLLLKYTKQRLYCHGGFIPPNKHYKRILNQLKRVDKAEEKVRKLEYVVAKMGDRRANFDTTKQERE